MSKIPVGETIAQTYRFAFGGFIQILKVVWLPWVILAMGGLLIRSQATALSNALTTRDFSAVAHLLMPMLPFYALAVIFLFMQIAGITQLALGIRAGSPYYYFSLGKPVWRLLGAFLLVALIAFGSYFLLIAAGVLLGLIVAILSKLVGFSGLTSGILAIVGVLAIIAAFCAYIYSIVRMTFLMNPVAIAEQRISLKRSWALAGGNFWRIIVIILAILVPIMIVQLVVMFGFLSHGFPPMPPLRATADQIAANRTQMAAWNADMIKRTYDYWYVVYPVYVVFAGLFYGLVCGAQSFAYRALVPETASSASHP